LNIAWAAGLFEGEGSISIDKRNDVPALHMSMTDKDVVERFAEIVGVGSITHRPYEPPLKEQWAWQASGTNAVNVLNELLPWLGARRRARAEEVLARRAAVVAEATAPRVCPGCGTTFATPYYSGWRKRRYCEPACQRGNREAA
jgi:hypothetical protein